MVVKPAPTAEAACGWAPDEETRNHQRSNGWALTRDVGYDEFPHTGFAPRMNYFAHGRRYLHDPYYVAGTSLPDWLSVFDRRIRVRSRHAEPWVHDPDPRMASLARGVVRHHWDDRWFHQTRAFTELCLDFTVGVRDRLTVDDPGMRPSFVGHILVEILLDAWLIHQQPGLIDEYYRSVREVDGQWTGTAVGRMSGTSVVGFDVLIDRFNRERFLYDYLDDGKLLMRLNHVMKRVRLAPLPVSLTEWFPYARLRVSERVNELLAGEESAPALPGDQTDPPPSRSGEQP